MDAERYVWPRKANTLLHCYLKRAREPDVFLSGAVMAHGRFWLLFTLLKKVTRT